MDDENAKRLPSGDHDGALVVPCQRGKLTTRLTSSEYISISALPWEKDVNATRVPSGETAGESAIEFWCVNCFGWARRNPSARLLCGRRECLLKKSCFPSSLESRPPSRVS